MSHIFIKVFIWLHIIVLNMLAGGPISEPATTAALQVTDLCLRIIDFVVQQRKTQGEASPHHQRSEWGNSKQKGAPGGVAAAQLCFVISHCCQSWYRAPRENFITPNSTEGTNSNLISLVIFSLEMLERVMGWLIEEHGSSDRILTWTQQAACHTGCQNDVWESTLKTKHPHLQGDPLFTHY